MNKKIVSSLAALAVFLMPFGTANAADAGSAIEVASVTAEAGKDIQVPINITANSGIIAMSITVDYDATNLKLTKAEDKALFADMSYTGSGSIDLVPYRLMWDSLASANYTNVGELAVLTFHVSETAAPGEYPIKLVVEQDNTFDVNLDEVAFTTVDGKITVGGGAVTTTEAPVVTTEAPVVTTSAAPVVTTSEAPVVTTSGTPAVTTSEAPASSSISETTASAVSSDSAPASVTTSEAAASSAAPVVTTSEAATETEPEKVTTAASAQSEVPTSSAATTAAVTTAAPVESTAAATTAYSNDDLCAMAVKDYVGKNEGAEVLASAAENNDGTVSITLTDKDGKKVSVYTVDPATGKGVDATGAAIDLPQTGITGFGTYAAVGGAFAMLAAGAWLTAAVARKKDEE